MLLHACCGPCSMEPSRLLCERGQDFDIFYSNSNIGPDEEYRHRLATLKAWAESEGIDVIEDVYDHDVWAKLCKEPYQTGEIDREERCRRCYGMRFEGAAEYARANGYGELCTTLSVSPYQYTDVIAEELEHACADQGLECAFEDFRPYYDEATRRSRAAGMYRQNYCGCEISAAESEAQRRQRREERRLEKERFRSEHAEELAAEEAELNKRREQRREYDEKRARQKAILKQFRQGRGQA